MNTCEQRISPQRERGLAATAAALLLFFAMGIILAYTNRNLIFEQRTSANQYRATKAFEAAEAGIEWAIAQLNGDTKIDLACASDTTGANAFKERYLSINTGSGAITAGTLKPICTVPDGGGAFTCSCPTSGTATVSGSGAAFKVQFETQASPGIVRLRSFGCTSAAGDCDPAGSGTPDATAQVTVLLGIIPQVATFPGAAITAVSSVSIGNAALGVINTDVDTNGITIDSGSTITAPNARITTIPGSPPESSIIQNDPSLTSISTDQLFATFFGLSKSEFKAAATVINCGVGGCGDSDIANAINSACLTCRFLWVEGDLSITGNAVYGDTTNPVVLVVNGTMHMNGQLQLTGLVYASAWDETGGGSSFLRGAAISETTWTGNGTPDIYFDPSVLRQLTRVPANFIKIPGSWKDF
jgi:Tfp pilus assembly protein PilX